MRLDRFLSLASVGTRKRCKEYVYGGQVCVNGEVCCVPHYEIDAEADEVEYLEMLVKIDPVYYVFNKPQGCVSARVDSMKTVLDYFAEVPTEGLFPVGRLDKDTEGLLFVTNDGGFSHRLMSPEAHVSKTYYFMTLGSLGREEIEKLEEGVDIGLERIAKASSIQVLKTGMFEELVSEIGLEKMRPTKRGYKGREVTIATITIEEGMKHQVKRMLKHVGGLVLYLKRIAIGNYSLPEDLEVGSYRSIQVDQLP
ncbi:MAG: pseudouridine synthase [Lachnospiraceae bacterium]